MDTFQEEIDFHNISVITKIPLENGGAATVRLGLWKKGLESSGKTIKFFSSYNVLAKSNSRFQQIINYFKYYLFVYKSLRKMESDDKLDMIFIFGQVNLLLTYLARRLNVLLVTERTEYPFIGKTSLKDKIELWIYLRLTKRFDLILTISEALGEYFKKIVGERTRILKISTMVDLKEFSSPIKADISNYIVYCGSMGGNKDGVPILIEAFSKISEKHPDINLKLIGTADEKTMTELREMVSLKGLENRVLFTGKIPHDQMSSNLVTARVLCLARPDNKQAEGGFPIKLGEYLATGRPVLTTRVGEFDQYLTNKESVFFCHPDDSADFANKLNYILLNEKEAVEVGIKGQEVAKEFDYNRQVGKFLKHISTEHVKNTSKNPS